MKNQKIRPWLSLLSAFLVLFSCTGLGTNGISLFYVPVTSDLGFTQTAFSAYYTITMLVGAVFSPVIGKLYTKHQNWMRRFMFIGAVVTLGCFFLYSRCSTLPQFYAVSVLRGIANATLSSTAATMVVNNWFVERRALATSLCLMGTSAGGVVFTQLSKMALQAWGWRTSYWALGLIGFAVNMLMLFLMEPNPEKVKMVPYGCKGSTENVVVEKHGLTCAQALRTPSFWLVLVGTFIACITVQGTQQAVTTALQVDSGHTMTLASTVVTIFMTGLCVGKFVIGMIIDHKGLVVGVTYSCLLLVVSFICLLLSGSAVFAIAFGVIFGFGNMMGSMIPATSTTTIFGTKEYGVIYGFIQLAVQGGCAIGPMISSKIYDGTGSYHVVWILYAAFVVTATIMTITAHKLMKKRLEVM